MSRSPDELAETLRVGQQAREALFVLNPMLEARLSQVVNEAVGAYRKGNCDGTRALSYLAALSEVLALRENLELQIMRGDKAAETLFSPSSTA